MKPLGALILFLLLGSIASPSLAEAHGQEEEAAYNPLNPTNFIIASTFIAVIIIALSIALADRLSENAKKISFIIIALAVLLSTANLVVSTISLNIASETGGPVHWHADFEIWACGERIVLAHPASWLDNKVGTPILHHHDDNRIHIEGAVKNLTDVSLGEFFEVIGGEISGAGMTVDTEDGVRIWANGNECQNGSGNMQVFVYRTENGIYTQEKISNIYGHIISPHGNVPPGDCIIIEFSPEAKERTDRICETYSIAIERGEIHG